MKGKRIANLHHGSGYGCKTKEILDIQAAKYGFEAIAIEVKHPGDEQNAQWQQIVAL